MRGACDSGVRALCSFHQWVIDSRSGVANDGGRRPFWAMNTIHGLRLVSRDRPDRRSISAATGTREELLSLAKRKPAQSLLIEHPETNIAQLSLPRHVSDSIK